MCSTKNILVIGGNGFLGKHIVEYCLKNNYKTSVLDISPPLNKNPDVEYYVGSLCEESVLNSCLPNQCLVVHCASPPEYLNDYDLFVSVNVTGTKNLIKCCINNKVKKIILVSSASVVYEGTDILNGKETLPYATHYISPYVQTKIEQEKLILQANNNVEQGYLQTVAIRPHGIFGPGDPLLVPQVLKAAKEGKMRFIIGNGNNIVDFTYVENIAHAIILLIRKLDESYLANNNTITGQAFNITNDEPTFFWAFISKVLKYNGFDSPKYRIPYTLVYVIAYVLECVVHFLNSIISFWYGNVLGQRSEKKCHHLPSLTFTPMRVALLSTHHSYDCKKAKELIGYKPLYSLQEGFEKTMQILNKTHATGNNE